MYCADSITNNSAGGQVFGLPLSKCLENERFRMLQQAELSAAVAETAAATVAAAAAVAGDDILETACIGAGASGVCYSRKSSRTGSRTSFCSLAEGAKQVRLQLVPKVLSLCMEHGRP